jgi:succinate dehydrogenase / fumarate reductase, membrane anchor subunit
VLVPLALWFVISIIGLRHADYGVFKSWLHHPFNATLMLATVLTVVYHGQLGVQVVIEDYVHGASAKFASLIAVKVVAALLAVYMAVSVLTVAIGV